MEAAATYGGDDMSNPFVDLVKRVASNTVAPIKSISGLGHDDAQKRVDPKPADDKPASRKSPTSFDSKPAGADAGPKPTPTPEPASTSEPDTSPDSPAAQSPVPDQGSTPGDGTPIGPTTSQSDLRTGSHHGKRDERIKDLEGDIDSLEKKTTVANIASSVPILGWLAKPVVDAAVTDDAKQDLGNKRSELRQEKVLNFLADTMYALGAPVSLVNALDGGAHIKVVKDADLDSDAAYNSQTKAVEIPETMIIEAQRAQQQLQKDGIVSKDGKILDQARLDQSAVADDLVKAANLVGTHEMTHLTQDQHGVIDQSNQLQNSILEHAVSGAAHLAPEDTAAVRESAEADAEKARVAVEEVPAYVAQEQSDLRLGASRQVLVAVDQSGAPLPTEQAVENVIALQNGDPLLHGVSAGWSPPAEPTTSPLQSFLEQLLPGIKHPGIKHPGLDHPGIKHPGIKHPGIKHPGHGPDLWTWQHERNIAN